MNTLSEKESSSLQFNGIRWKVSVLGERVLLLQAPRNITTDQIHQSARMIETTLKEDLMDMVPAYDSIALFSDVALNKILHQLDHPMRHPSMVAEEKKEIVIPICYEMGTDLEEISKRSGLKKEEIIAIHLSGKYKVIFIGFTPGFIYADGLDPRLECPRKASPRTHIPAGSIGIGGRQTGIYSLNSPGGWNIIGRTPIKLFNINKRPPMSMETGTVYYFKRITKEEFEVWES